MTIVYVTTDKSVQDFLDMRDLLNDLERSSDTLEKMELIYKAMKNGLVSEDEAASLAAEFMTES